MTHPACVLVAIADGDLASAVLVCLELDGYRCRRLDPEAARAELEGPEAAPCVLVFDPWPARGPEESALYNSLRRAASRRS